MLLITTVRRRHLAEWLSLARELEPLFGEPMADVKGFRQFAARRIAGREALVALDRVNGDTVMGVIAFSPSKNRISWLGVSARYRRQSVGSELLRAALMLLDRTKEISVVTFRGDGGDARAAKALYKKFGFLVTDDTVTYHGLPRCLMTRPAESTPPGGGSRHA